MLFVGDSQG
jgi:jouberin